MGVSTITMSNILHFLNFNFSWSKTSSIVRTITERLNRGFTTRTPPIYNRVKFHDCWPSTGCRHGVFVTYSIIPDPLLHGRSKEPHRHIS